MPKVNVYLPDGLAEAVKHMDLPVSVICQRALEHATQRMTAIRAITRSDLDAADLVARLPRFTDRARDAIRLAVEQDRAAGGPGVGTARLLGGLLAEGGNLALRVLRSLEIDPLQVERELRRPPAGEGSPGGDPGRRWLTPHAADALERSVGEAIALGHTFVGCEHLLLGLVVEPEGIAGQLLRGLGAEPRLARRAVTAALAGYAHRQAQAGEGNQPADVKTTVATSIRDELRPLVHRIDRIEERLGLPAGP
jgi:ATP-dependent Clp protease ATP-binding subunit ClpA